MVGRFSGANDEVMVSFSVDSAGDVVAIVGVLDDSASGGVSGWIEVISMVVSGVASTTSVTSPFSATGATANGCSFGSATSSLKEAPSTAVEGTFISCCVSIIATMAVGG